MWHFFKPNVWFWPENIFTVSWHETKKKTTMIYKNLCSLVKIKKWNKGISNFLTKTNINTYFCILQWLNSCRSKADTNTKNCSQQKMQPVNTILQQHLKHLLFSAGLALLLLFQDVSLEPRMQEYHQEVKRYFLSKQDMRKEQLMG